MRFHVQRLRIPDVLLIDHGVARDDRGFFAVTYVQAALAPHGIPPFVQDAYSRSGASVLRGFHYQLDPFAQGKLVRCVRGRVFDVAVDLRRRSPSFRRWVAVDLSEDDHRMLYIPEGFAHGFCVLGEEAEVFYKMTASYSPAHARVVRWNDRELGIPWPISNPRVSGKDMRAPLLAQAEINFEDHRSRLEDVAPSITS